MSYETRANCTYRVDEETGERTMLANFTATIEEEIRIVDGRNNETILIISGKQTREGKDFDLPAIKVQASQFAGMAWVMQNWGVRAIVQPGGSIKEDLRTQIQQSSEPKVQTIYRHTGWTVINGERAYLHAGGAITRKGNDPSVKVELPQELSNYNLAGEINTKEAVRATLALLEVGPKNVMWPMLAATLAPLWGPVDFAMHLTGRTGTYKSEIVSLFQSHYGSRMDARHLPGSWSSTANALEAQSFLAANAAFVIDDFVPSGTSWQVRSYQTTADKVIRSQGNQSGRARLTDTTNLQSAMFPRGIVISTGEDTPEGHSVRARMMIMELSPGDIDLKKLTAAQAKRAMLPGTTVGLIKQLAECEDCLDSDVNEVRAEHIGIGHTRTPGMMARLLVTADRFLIWATKMKFISGAEEKRLFAEAEEAITRAAGEQITFLENADPVDIFCATIRSMLQAGQGHIRTLNGGIPKKPTMLGWTTVGTPGEDIPTYKSHGPTIGWIDWNKGEVYIDATGGYNTIRKVAGPELALTKQTMMKRLKDAGTLTRVDDARQRNTVRITAENHPRQVLSLSITQVLDTQEVPE